MPGRRAAVAIAAGVLVSSGLTATTVSNAAPAAAATATFAAVADTYTHSGSAGTNYGTAAQLGVDGSPAKQTFLKFAVGGVSGRVTSAKLRIHTADVPDASSDNGGVFRAMSSTGWTETGLTWSNQPALGGASLGTLGQVSPNTWYEVDVTSHVTGNGAFGIGISSTSGNGTDYDSRESGSATAPRLVVTTDGGTTSPPGGAPVLVGVGDIANEGNGDEATAKLLDGISGTVFTTGDNAYPNGSASDYANYYAPTWGRHKARTKPVPGNHEYVSSGAAPYYSYDLGNWHIVALNSNISASAGSAQEKWLRSDLAASGKPCTLAYWHHSRFTSSASHTPSTAVGPLVQALYDYNAEVIVTGHNHQYERFAPLNPAGKADASRGIRHFVAGMGGAGYHQFGTIQPGSEARNSDTRGVLKFTLQPNGYDWKFLPVEGKTFTDSGTTGCH
ncbi:DNRLRE domain-containing protein [Streptomyces sp. ODS05-4]|uniref:CBM96 family carbohydrate-binding protein n=1 Tax=Streptomyces sp. ODS05-4 TaxID=2944939 RepID=UPI00210866B6|nr:DNRLRE domain-containing protein [Streptomyces sp. ODS05-4]